MTISIDIETVATTPDAAILSIGAVKFSTKTGDITDRFYVTLDSSLQHSRKRCLDTLRWWSKQDPKAYEDAFKSEYRLREGLGMLSDWMKPYRGDKIWAKGSSFDFSILKHAFNFYGMETPWKFYNEMDLRVLNYLGGRLKFKALPALPQGEFHNALADAAHQASQIIKFHKDLGI